MNVVRQFVEAVAAHDLDAAEKFLDPDVETVTPRGPVRGITACRQVLQKAAGDEQFAMEQAEPQFEDVEGDVIARTLETARWRETGEVASTETSSRSWRSAPSRERLSARSELYSGRWQTASMLWPSGSITNAA